MSWLCWFFIPRQPEFGVLRVFFFFHFEIHRSIFKRLRIGQDRMQYLHIDRYIYIALSSISLPIPRCVYIYIHNRLSLYIYIDGHFSMSRILS
jgi:hypothetical protein